MSAIKPAPENLQRVIGVRSLALSILNLTVGSGIFVIPALIAEGLGATAIIAYFVCGLLIFCIALCFAKLGSNTSISGGPYTYIEQAFGPFAGFLANNLFWLGCCVVSDAAISNALADTLSYFFPSLNHYAVRVIFMLLLFGGFMLLNIRSVKNGVRLIEFATVTKLVPLLILVLFSIKLVDPANLQWVIRPSIANIGTASLLLFYAFIGLEGPLSNGGEIRNPRRTVPLGVTLGIGAVLILYIAIQLIVQGVLGEGIAQHKDAPLAAVAGIRFGSTGIVVCVVIIGIAMLGSLGGEILSIPRILFAGARDGLLPKALSRVHPNFKTPHVAITVYGSLGFLLAISGGFAQLAIISSATILLIYLGVVLSSVKMRRKAVPVQETAGTQPFRIPGGLLVPILATAGIGWLLSNLAAREIIGIAIFLAVFSLIFVVMKLVNRKVKPVIG